MADRRNSHISVSIDNGSLGELRAAVASLADLPDEAEVRVRTNVAMHAHGGHLSKLNISVPEGKG